MDINPSQAPMPQFQQPNLDMSFRPTAPPDLDSVFNTVIRAQVAKSQIQAQQQQMQQADTERRLQLAGQGIDASGDVNKQISQGLNQYNNSINGQGQPAGAPSLQQKATPQQAMINDSFGSPQSPSIHPDDASHLNKISSDIQNPALLSGYAQHLQLVRNMALLGGAKSSAEAAKTQSEADLNQMWKNQLTPGGQSGADTGTPQSPWAANLRSDVSQGLKSPSQAQAEASRVGPQGMGRFMVDNALQGLPQADLEAAYSGKTAAANTANSPAVKIPQYNAEALNKSLEVFDKIQKSIPRSDYQAINGLSVKAAIALGGARGRVAQRMMSQAQTASEQYQSAFGAGSDKKLALAENVLSTSQTIDQLSDSIKILEADVQNKTNAYKGIQGTVHPDFGDGETRTLNDGNTVKVKRNQDGSYTEVP